MKSHSFASTALIFSILLSGCGIQNMNHSAKSQSYHNMGNQGYNVKPGQNSASTQSVKSQANTRKTLDGSFDLYQSQQLEAKLNRAGVTGYSVLASKDTVILGLAYPQAEERKSKQNSSKQTTNTGSSAGLSTDQGFGSTSAPNVSPTSDKGFGTPSSPSLNDSSNQINGVPVKDLETKNSGNQSINQISNTANNIPMNPGLSQNSSIPQTNSRSAYMAQEIVKREMGNNTDVIFVADQAGVNAVTTIKQKLSTQGTPNQASIQSEVHTLENSINQ